MVMLTSRHFAPEPDCSLGLLKYELLKGKRHRVVGQKRQKEKKESEQFEGIAASNKIKAAKKLKERVDESRQIATKCKKKL